MSLRSVLPLILLLGCGSLEADESQRTEADPGDQGFWWLWTPSVDDTDEDEQPEEPREPGDPDWFDAHCDDVRCDVADDFDPIVHLEAAHALCADAVGEPSLYFQRVSFTTERVDAEDFRASDADWEYRFVVPDPDDLWGYTWIDCRVEVTNGAVTTDSTYTAGTITRIEPLLATYGFGIADALDDLGSFASVSRGGIRWDRLGQAGEVYLVDDRWGDEDTWDAATGERD